VNVSVSFKAMHFLFQIWRPHNTVIFKEGTYINKISLDKYFSISCNKASQNCIGTLIGFDIYFSNMLCRT